MLPLHVCIPSQFFGLLKKQKICSVGLALTDSQILAKWLIYDGTSRSSKNLYISGVLYQVKQTKKLPVAQLKCALLGKSCRELKYISRNGQQGPLDGFKFNSFDLIKDKIVYPS